MLRRPLSWKWVAAASAGALALGMITYVSIVRLDVADRVASVVSAVVSVVFLIAEFGVRSPTRHRAGQGVGAAATTTAGATTGATGGTTGGVGWRSPHRVLAVALAALVAVTAAGYAILPADS